MSSVPCFIGITGPSGSGKTTLAKALVRHLGEAAVVVPLDAYYRDLSSLSPAERAQRNFDVPDALEHELLLEHLQVLRSGESVTLPDYDFRHHVRRPGGRIVHPCPYVVIEGLFVLHWPEIRDMLCLSVYVDTDDNTCLQRRIERDTRERGRTEASVRQQYAQTVRPMMSRYVLPLREHADLVVSGTAAAETNLQGIIEWIRRHGPAPKPNSNEVLLS